MSVKMTIAGAEIAIEASSLHEVIYEENRIGYSAILRLK
jgi:hypothetical protein